MRDYFELKEILANISVNMEWIEGEMAKFKGSFEQYSYLWLEDPQMTFEKFLIENEPKEDEFLKDTV
jgi:hypothetical protein